MAYTGRSTHWQKLSSQAERRLHLNGRRRPSRSSLAAGSSQGRQKGSPGPELTCLSSRGQNSQAQRATWLCMSVIYLPPAPTAPHTCTAVRFQYPKGDRFSSQHSLSKCTCHVPETCQLDCLQTLFDLASWCFAQHLGHRRRSVHWKISRGNILPIHVKWKHVAMFGHVNMITDRAVHICGQGPQASGFL